MTCVIGCVIGLEFFKKIEEKCLTRRERTDIL